MAESQILQLTLMCRDHEVARFAWDTGRQAVVGKVQKISPRYLPICCLDPQGSFVKSGLTAWFRDRGIPALRPMVKERLQQLGYTSVTEIMARGFGLSLSDQYWLRPVGSSASWDEINCFTNAFPEEFGELMLPHDDSSMPDIIKKLRSSDVLLKSSPDAALNGNLPKRWRIEPDGTKVLVKAGRASCRYQEPFNEVAATALCARLMGAGEYVSYALEDNGFAKWASVCPTMVDEFSEFVPAFHIHASSKVSNDQSLFDFYVSACRAHGLDVLQAVEKMLVVDYLTANFDRHWNNFGIIVDTETREWKAAAPIFDTGESFWCNVDTGQPFRGYVSEKAGAVRPFARDIDSQLERFCMDMSWFDARMLDGFAEEACEILRGNPFIANDPGRIDKLHQALCARVDRVGRHAATLR